MNGIKNQKEIGEVFQLGKKFRISSGLLIVYTSDHPRNKKEIKLLVMVKKRIAHSVLRNRIRRVIREAVRSAAKSVPEGKEVRLIFLVNQTEVDFHKIKYEVENRLKFIFSSNRNLGSNLEKS